MRKNSHRKHWIHLTYRIFQLYITQTEKTSDLVKRGYTNISKYYDNAWTNHMRYITDEMIKRLNPKKNSNCLDLSCGTGYVTGKLFEITNGYVIGVDLSPGMLAVAEKKYGKKSKFVQSDILDFLKSQSDNSYDIVTCAWALGFSKPYQIICEIKRILRKNGKVGIIDNTLSTVYEMFIAGIYTVAENPRMLKHIFKIHPLGNNFSLYIRLKMNKFKILDKWNGEKTYYAVSGNEVIKRLIETGTASAYQYFIYDKYYTEVLKRYPINVEKLYMTKKGIPITHRFIATIAQKK